MREEIARDGAAVRPAASAPTGQAGVIGPNAALQLAAAMTQMAGAEETGRLFAAAGLSAWLTTPPGEMVPAFDDYCFDPDGSGAAPSGARSSLMNQLITYECELSINRCSSERSESGEALLKYSNNAIIDPYMERYDEYDVCAVCNVLLCQCVPEPTLKMKEMTHLTNPGLTGCES